MQTWTVEKARVLLMMHLFRDLTVKAYYSSAYCTSNILKLTTLPVLRNYPKVCVKFIFHSIPSLNIYFCMKH